MKKLIKTPTETTISISELCERIEEGEHLIVYYRTNDNRSSYPSFLKYEPKKSYFISPIARIGTAYEANTLKECLENVIISRHVYVIHRDEQSELFKLQP